MKEQKQTSPGPKMDELFHIKGQKKKKRPKKHSLFNMFNDVFDSSDERTN